MPATETSASCSPHRVDDALAVAEALCARRGRRFTPIRRKVLELLLRHQRSLKAYELLDEIRAIHPNATPPTVYRALDFLLEEGLVHRVDTLNTFIACGDADGAPHNLLVVCTGCGAVAEIHDDVVRKRLADRIDKAGFKLSGGEMEVKALCKNCQASQREDAHTHQHAH
ncbi:transcriptional repressor [Verticiella sediminum]|uniref:Transcriptional repressor n=1 Tax=Verticiella sediminum TaxID=1247510 RepID=A0A556AC98_9BURK|nr:Fur family transcriptional regulator [Verticiella sediminum]TSH90511.1 transcriptional repressor [Verticiella sediminum]